MMIDPMRTTADRWTRAAQRAISADLPHQLTRRGGAVVVPSTSQRGRSHFVALTSGGRVGPCSCDAGVMGAPCRHRAAVALRLYERETGARVQWVKRLDAATVARYFAGEVAA